MSELSDWKHNVLPHEIEQVRARGRAEGRREALREAADWIDAQSNAWTTRDFKRAMKFSDA